MIIRADKYFIEALQSAGYKIDFPKLRVIYGNTKDKRLEGKKPKKT